MGQELYSKFIYCLMITALLTAVIAPACQAAWGNNQTLLEICTAQGIKMVAVPSSDQSAPADEDNAPSLMPNCDFCFQNNHIHFADVEAATLIHTKHTLPRYKITAEDAEYIDPLLCPYNSQAPPFLFGSII